MRWGFVFLRPREKASWPPRILTGMDLIFLSLFFMTDGKSGPSASRRFTTRRVWRVPSSAGRVKTDGRTDAPRHRRPDLDVLSAAGKWDPYARGDLHHQPAEMFITSPVMAGDASPRWSRLPDQALDAAEMRPPPVVFTR